MEKITKKDIEKARIEGIKQGVQYGITVERMLLPEDHKCPDMSCEHCKKPYEHMCSICYTMWDAPVEFCPDDSCENSSLMIERRKRESSKKN